MSRNTTRARTVRTAACALALSAVALGTWALAATPGSNKDIRRMAQDAPLLEAGQYPAEMVAGGPARFKGEWLRATTYRSDDRRFVVSLWQSGPGVLKTDSYPHDEYCLVVEGRVIITNASSDSRTEYGVGDAFILPKGWAGTWDMPVRFKKQFVAFLAEPDPEAAHAK